MTEDSAARTFWRWFERSRTLIEAGVQEGDAGVVAEIHERVAALHPDVSWEIGPGERASWMLAISPNGDPDLLPTTEAIVAEAPRVPDWEFFSAKPPRQWLDDSRQFEYGGAPIDATDWTYALVAFNQHEFYDITWVVPNIEALGDIDPVELATFVLHGEVGELIAITRFDQIKLVELGAFDSQLPVSPIATLRAQLQLFRHH